MTKISEARFFPLYFWGIRIYLHGRRPPTETENFWDKIVEARGLLLPGVLRQLFVSVKDEKEK